MTSSIIHDLKNPLSVISAYVQMLNRSIKHEKFQKYFDILDKEINKRGGTTTLGSKKETKKTQKIS